MEKTISWDSNYFFGLKKKAFLRGFLKVVHMPASWPFILQHMRLNPYWRSDGDGGGKEYCCQMISFFLFKSGKNIYIS